MSRDDLFFMREAYALALKAQSVGEVPVGAVLVSSDLHIIGRGWNQVLKTNDPTAHAEIIAIREAAQNLNNYRLNHNTLYVTLEPCAMCAGALVHARIGRLVFATRDFKAGAAGSVYNLLNGVHLNHKIVIDEGILQEESAALLTCFFKSRR